MNRNSLRPSRDPFEMLAFMTAAALSVPLPAQTSHSDVPVANGKPKARGSLLDRLDRWVWKARQRDLKRALTSATDVAEVEKRLRERERSLLERYY